MILLTSSDDRLCRANFKMQINKSVRNDAAGIVRIMQTGWFKKVRVKDIDSHSVRAPLASRALLVKIKRDLENQIRVSARSPRSASRRRSTIRHAASDREVLAPMSD